MCRHFVIRIFLLPLSIFAYRFANSTRNRTPSGSPIYSFLIDAIFLSIALWLCYPNWFNFNTVSLSGDFFCLFLPGHHLNREAWTSSIVPLWNPYIFCGHPFAATMQMGCFYPPTAIVALAPSLLTGMKIFRIFHVWLFGFSIYLWLRLHYSHQRRAALAAAAMATCSAFVAHHGDHINQLASLSWLPAVFWAWQSMLHYARHSAFTFNRKTIVRLVLFSALLALQYLTGHPQNVFYTLLLCAGYGLFWFFFECHTRIFSKAALTTLGISISAVALALALASLQLLPTMELAPRTYRIFDGYRYATAYSMNPQYLLQMIVPYWFGNPLEGYRAEGNFAEFGCYIGIIAVLTIGISLLNGSFWRNKTNLFFLAMAILVILLTFGSHTPLYKLFYWAFYPIVRHLRAPPRILALNLLCFAYLLSFAFQQIANRFDTMKRSGKFAWMPTARVLAPALLFLMLLEYIVFQQNQAHTQAQSLNNFAIAVPKPDKNQETQFLADAESGQIALRGNNADSSTILPYKLGRLKSLEQYLSTLDPSINPMAASRVATSRILRLHPSDFNLYNMSAPSELPEDGDPPLARDLNPDDARSPWSNFPTFVRKQMFLPNLNHFSSVRTVAGYEEGLAPTIRFQDFLAYYNRNLRNQNPDRRLLQLMAVDAVLFEFFSSQPPDGFRVPNPQDFSYTVTAPLPGLEYPLAWFGGVIDPRSPAQWLDRIDPRINLKSLEGPWYRSKGRQPPQIPINRNPVNYFTASPAAPWGLSNLNPSRQDQKIPLKIESLSLNRWRVKWEQPLPQARFLWISQAAYPGWHAQARIGDTVEAVMLHDINAIGYLVDCPRDSTQIDIYYEPDSFRTGLFVSLMALAGLATLLSIHVRRRDAS